jgi:hypothetical protein
MSNAQSPASIRARDGKGWQTPSKDLLRESRDPPTTASTSRWRGGSMRRWSPPIGGFMRCHVLHAAALSERVRLLDAG